MIWTAIRPEYGSFLLGVALITFGACWVGIMCALKRTRDEMKEASDSEETSELYHDETSSMTSALNEVRAGYQTSLMRPMTYRDNVFPHHHHHHHTSTASTLPPMNALDDVRESPDGAEEVMDPSRFV